MNVKFKFYSKAQPQISIIVPFYNIASEKLKRCLNSIIAYTHVNYEVLLVDDGSQGECSRIAKWYSRKYKQFHVFRHLKNRGLFSARITALKHVNGEFIGFVDSDDYISDRYFDNLLESAKQEQADVAIGQIVLENTDGYQYIQDRCYCYPYGFCKDNLSDYDLFWKQEGQCYPFHVLWNKIYRKKLWDENRLFLEKNQKHLIMTEDMVFSTVFLAKANKISYSAEAVYFYVQSPTSSVGNKSFHKLLKNIDDLSYAFYLVQLFLCTEDIYYLYQTNYDAWKQRYARYWTRNVETSSLNEEKKRQCMERLAEIFGRSNLTNPTEEDDFYYMSSVPYNK